MRSATHIYELRHTKIIRVVHGYFLILILNFYVCRLLTISAGLQSNLASSRTVLNKVRLGASGPVGFVGFMVLNRRSQEKFPSRHSQAVCINYGSYIRVTYITGPKPHLVPLVYPSSPYVCLSKQSLKCLKEGKKEIEK
jgi:hypothetical protein